MEYSEEDGKFNISIRLFADDFANILERINKQKINLTAQSKYNDNIINQYIKQHFKVKINNTYKPKLMSFESYKYIDNGNEKVIQIYYSLKSRKTPTQIHITNSIMTDLFRDQKNLLIFSCKNTEKALSFESSNLEENFTIN